MAGGRAGTSGSDGPGGSRCPAPACRIRLGAFTLVDGPGIGDDGGAEREGFEPSRGLAPPTRLAGECLQPLGHLSGEADSTDSATAPDTLGSLAAPRQTYEYYRDLFDGIDGVSGVEMDGSLVRLLAKAPMDAAVKAAARHEIVDLHSTEPDLEELFLGMYGDAENGEKDDAPERAVTDR